MFCPQCGAPLAEGSKVCSACNHTLKFIPKKPEVIDSTTPVSKTKYFLKVADQKQKIICIVALLLGVLSVLSVVLAANKTVNGSIFKIPLIALAGDISGVDEDIADLEDEWSNAVDEAEDNLDELEDMLEDMLDISIDDVEEEIGMSTKKFIKLLDPISINNMVKIAKALDVDDTDVVAGFKIVITIINVIALVLAVIAGLGVIFQKTWLMVLSYVLSFFFILATGGILWIIIASIAFITTAVLFSKMKLEYKVYLAGYGIK